MVMGSTHIFSTNMTHLLLRPVPLEIWLGVCEHLKVPDYLNFQFAGVVDVNFNRSMQDTVIQVSILNLNFTLIESNE